MGKKFRWHPYRKYNTTNIIYRNTKFNKQRILNINDFKSSIYLFKNFYRSKCIFYIIIIIIDKLLIYNIMQKQMYKRWIAYSLRMRNARQKYMTLFRQQVKSRSARAIANTRRRIIRGVFLGTSAIVAYLFCNEMYSEHLEKKKMKKKLMKAYPDQTYIISFQEDPIQLLRQVEIKSAQDEVNPLQNKHCVLINEDTQQIKKLKQKLGPTVIVFSPKNLDQFCHVIQRCHKYRHSAIVGDYPMPNFDNLDLKQLTNALIKINQPMRKNKYVVVDLSLFKNLQIDNINDILSVDTGIRCKQINTVLQSKGFEPLFQKYCDDLSLYEVLVNNLPLCRSQTLVGKIYNLSLISAQGKRFKSATQVSSFGQIPNLTPLFLGTGGVFAVPAKANIRINRKSVDSNPRYYSIQSENISDLIIKWRRLRQNLSLTQTPYKLTFQSPTKLLIQTPNQLTLPQYIGHKQQQISPQQINTKQISYIFSINNKIIQKLLLNNSHQPSITINNNVLQIQQNIQQQKLLKLISDISVEGGVLVWCRDKQFYAKIKERTDLLEAGAELMKKIVEIREGIDKRQVLYSHSRYEKYFAKGTFRKLTEFFW